MKINLDDFFHTRSIAKAADLYPLLSSPEFFASDTGVSYRNLNHWDSKGLLRSTRKSKGRDRIFSFIDLAWVKVVAELRAFEVPIPVIQSITKSIHEPLPLQEIMDMLVELPEFDKLLESIEGEEVNEVKKFFQSGGYKEVDISDVKIGYFHLAIVQAIVDRDPLSLVVFKDGSWFPYSYGAEKHYPIELLNKKKFSTHVTVSLLDIVFQFLSSEKTVEILKDLKLLSQQEQRLLDLMDSGAFKKVTVHFESKEQEPVEISKGKWAKNQLIELIRNRQYDHFAVVDEKGKHLKI